MTNPKRTGKLLAREKSFGLHRVHIPLSERDRLSAFARQFQGRSRAAEKFIDKTAPGFEGSWSGVIKENDGTAFAVYMRADGARLWYWAWTADVTAAQVASVGKQLNLENPRRLTRSYRDFRDAVGRALGVPLKWACGMSLVHQ